MGAKVFSSDLAEYIFNNYQSLLTDTERKVCVLLQPTKTDLADPMEEEEQDLFGYLTPEMAEYIGMGFDNFRQHISQRLLRERGVEIVLNYCPKCGTLTATPRARFCLKCAHSWMDKF